MVTYLDTYWRQNQNPNHFQTIVSKFIIRLLDRGHTLQSLTPLLMQATTRIEQGQMRPCHNPTHKTLYIHWPYHPNGLQQKIVRKIYNETLHTALDYDHMQIAVSHPKTLKDILTRSTLTLPPDINLSEVIKQCRDKIHTNI